MDGLEFTIEQLKIKIYTNIPDKSLQMVDFTRDLLSYEDTSDEGIILESLPCFTNDIEYPLNILRKLEYSERINFFFNSEKFTEILRTSYSEDDELDAEDENYYALRERRTRKNIMTMIELIFPTKEPVKNDIHQSHDNLLLKTSTKPLWYDVFGNKYFSYLKINGKIYTIKKNVWLNDILNHPVYRKLVVEYRKLRKWADEKIQSKESKFKDPNKQIRANKDKLKQLFQELNNEMSNLLDREDESEKNKVMAVKFKNVKDVLDGNYNESDFIKITEDNTKYGWIKIRNTGKDVNKDDYDKLIEKIRKEYDNLNKNQTNMSELNEIFEEPINKVKNNDIIFRQFQAFMNTYREPIRKTSNIYLQELLDAVIGVTENEENNVNAIKYYKLMNALYKQYIAQEILTDEDLQNKNGDPLFVDKNNTIINLSNVGISYINIGQNNKPTKEIYIMIDLIDGKLTDENAGCILKSNVLGNRFETQIRKYKYPENKWAVDKNRKMIYLNELEKNNKENKMNENKEFNQDDKQVRNNTYSNNDKTTIYKNRSTLNANFQSQIVDNEKEKINKIISNMQQSYLDPEVQCFNTNELIKCIKNIKSSTDLQENSQKLYNVINLWNEDIRYKNDKLLEKMIGIETNLLRRNLILDEQLKVEKVKNDPTGKYKLIIGREKLFNELFDIIIKKLIMIEKKKDNKLQGGTRKKLRNYNRITKKKY